MIPRQCCCGTLGTGRLPKWLVDPSPTKQFAISAGGSQIGAVSPKPCECQDYERGQESESRSWRLSPSNSPTKLLPSHAALRPFALRAGAFVVVRGRRGADAPPPVMALVENGAHPGTAIPPKAPASTDASGTEASSVASAPGTSKALEESAPPRASRAVKLTAAAVAQQLVQQQGEPARSGQAGGVQVSPLVCIMYDNCGGGCAVLYLSAFCNPTNPGTRIPVGSSVAH